MTTFSLFHGRLGLLPNTQDHRKSDETAYRVKKVKLTARCRGQGPLPDPDDDGGLDDPTDSTPEASPPNHYHDMDHGGYTEPRKHQTHKPWQIPQFAHRGLSEQYPADGSSSKHWDKAHQQT
jgi:hypothetical protein